MVNKIKAAKRLFEKISLYDLMTSQPMIDAYIKHIKESDVPYESEDDEKEIEQMVEDFQEMMNERGTTIMKDLFSNSYINENPFANDEIVEFAKRFTVSDSPTEWLYWMQVLIGYTLYISKLYVLLDYEPHKDSKAKSEESSSPSTYPKDGFATWREALEWAAQTFEKAKNGTLHETNSPSASSHKSISLSTALKDLKSKENWTPTVAKAFAEVGISDPRELTPARFLSLLSKNKKKDKETGKYVIGIWGERKVKDHEGFYIRKPDGTYKTEPVLRKIGSWTKGNLQRVLAQNGIHLET